jgi:hypothetical protein
MLKFWLISGAISGFLSVGLGAFGAHSLKNILDEYGKSIYEKAVLYQMFHTLALFLVGILYHLFKETYFFCRRVGIPHWDRSLFREPICVGNHPYEMVGGHYSLWWCGISFWMVLADMDAWQGALLTLILLKQSCFKK